MTDKQPVPEAVYDAAIRMLQKKSQPDDYGIVRRWFEDQSLGDLVRARAMWAIGRAVTNGIARECVR